MKGFGLLALLAVAMAQSPAPALAEEGCVRPLGGPCVSGPAKGAPSNTCRTRAGSCAVSLAKGARCKCKGVRGIVR